MYFQGFYRDLSIEEIRKSVENEGFDPIRFSNGPGDVYLSHSHPETKLLAFLEGSMTVTVEDKVFNCQKGDKLIIPGDVTHSALVGEERCTFFWSEKLMQ